MSATSSVADRRNEFRALYDAEVRFLFNFLRRLGVPSAELEDVAQEVFTQVYAKLDQYDRSRPFRAWLTGFAVHAAADHRRKRAKRDVPKDDVETALGGAGENASRDAHEVVMHGLRSLSFDEREVLVLVDLYGHTMAESAQILNIPENTGYSRLRVARERFRAAVHALSKEDR
jgi:RNA polymerase sigma-70 factor (ECF subfamily)